ncbi:triphosphoribosyl-dephospho-CoA synthase [Novipirellula artificiosorum]|uniref:ATP:dephospho-CoA triphosphoribosyl transferase n=1 Tax=Novipirellula artificiosorum TaxID=2528016 RepID=A0A5C6DHR4_9BACT|nr:triphosphoribosyl-dephospho-CoA synthase [Novipirellula artificiosorum]TWU36092.1 ATP:dephospho-CoA triphosphoribosyl transferase [Novipirellula artificiosorum]
MPGGEARDPGDGADPLDAIRLHVRSVADAVRWACVLEATAPKAGNVFPGQSFDDLCFLDFMAAAEATAAAFADPGRRFSEMTLDAVRQTRKQCGSNVNLGITLLMAPLVEVVHSQRGSNTLDGAAAIARCLKQQAAQDAVNIFTAIRIASAGGLGKVDSMDVNDVSDAPIDLIAAMRSAAHHDAIAFQYTCGFADFFSRVVPTVQSAIVVAGDLLRGITNAHLELLADSPDTLISRKCGREAAVDVQRRACRLDKLSGADRLQFDQYLRSDGNRLNPGTTADLIAAALFQLLSSPLIETTHS